jgi:Phage major capsid protein E
MPNPTPSDLHINGYLTDLSVAYLNQASKFAAPVVFPWVDVQKQSDVYAIFDRGDFLRDGMQVRGIYDTAAQTGFRVSTADYRCEVWSLAKLVSDREKANADDPFRPDEDAAAFLTQQRLIRQEVDWCSTYFTTGVWTGSSTGTDLTVTAWDDVSSTPIENVEDESAEIESNTGMLPNTLVVNRRVWQALKNHPDIVDRVKHTSGASLTTDVVARLMGLDRIVIAAGVRNSAQEGATAAVDYIAGNHALLAYSASSPGLMTPSAGYIFRWVGADAPGGGGAQSISTFRDDKRRCDRHEIMAAWDCQAVSPLCGAFFSSVVS